MTQHENPQQYATAGATGNTKKTAAFTDAPPKSGTEVPPQDRHCSPKSEVRDANSKMEWWYCIHCGQRLRQKRLTAHGRMYFLHNLDPCTRHGPQQPKAAMPQTPPFMTPNSTPRQQMPPPIPPTFAPEGSAAYAVFGQPTPITPSPTVRPGYQKAATGLPQTVPNLPGLQESAQQLPHGTPAPQHPCHKQPPPIHCEPASPTGQYLVDHINRKHTDQAVLFRQIQSGIETQTVQAQNSQQLQQQKMQELAEALQHLYHRQEAIHKKLDSIQELHKAQQEQFMLGLRTSSGENISDVVRHQTKMLMEIGRMLEQHTGQAMQQPAPSTPMNPFETRVPSQDMGSWQHVPQPPMQIIAPTCPSAPSAPMTPTFAGQMVPMPQAPMYPMTPQASNAHHAIPMSPSELRAS